MDHPTPNDPTFRVLRGSEALEQLAPGWRRLQGAVRAAPMARIEWAESYVRTYGAASPDALRFFAVEDGGELVAVAPMVHHRGLGERRIESMGVAELFEPTDLLYRDPASLRVLLSGLLAQRLPVVLERVPSSGATVDQLVDLADGRAWVIRRPRVACPTVSLGGVDPEHFLNAGHRSDLRRFHRRAEKLGEVVTDISAPTRSELPSLLRTAFEIEASGWKGAQGDALLQQPRMRAFFEDYAGRAADAGILRLAFLRIGDHPVAMQLAIECSGALWLLKIGYDEAFASSSPGSLLMHEVALYAIRRGLDAVEFLGNAAPWTRMWTTLEYPTERVVALPVGLASATLVLRTILDKLPRRRHVP